MESEISFYCQLSIISKEFNKEVWYPAHQIFIICRFTIAVQVGSV